jgi:hypothetical protein
MKERLRWWLFDLALRYVCKLSPDTYGALYLWLQKQDKSLAAIINKTFSPDKLQFAWVPDETKRQLRKQSLDSIWKGENPLLAKMKEYGAINNISGGRIFTKDGHE